MADCFDIIKDHTEFAELFAEARGDNAKMREVASKALENLHGDLNKLKATLGKPVQPYKPVDRTADIEKKKAEYQNKIDELSTPKGNTSNVGGEDGLTEGANKILGLHDNGVSFDLFDNNKLREIAKENGIDLPEGAKNADIIEALKNKRNEATAKGLENLSEKDFDKLTPSQKVVLYKEHGITKEDGSPITEKDIENSPLQYSYDFMAYSDSGKWNSANSELESAVQGNRKQYSLYKLMNGEFDTFKEFVDFINSKNYGDKIEYTDRMKRADDMSPEERKAAVDSYNKSVEDKVGDKSQKEKDILDEHGLKDETEYSPHELVEKFPLKGVQKVIWDIISPIVKKLGIKVKFSSSRITEGFDGSSNPMNGEVLLRPSTLKNGRLGEVLVHEVVHSLTTKIISRVNSGVETGLTSKQVAAVKGLGKLYKSIEADNNLQNKYPVKDIFEFIAHLTNDTFVKELQSKDRNFIQKVVDFISDILGLSDANELAKKYLKDIIHDGTFLEKEGITVVSSDYAANVKGAEGLTPKQRLLEAIKNNSKTTAEKYHDLKSKGKENDFTKAVEQSLKETPTPKGNTSNVVIDEPNKSGESKGSVGVGGDVPQFAAKSEKHFEYVPIEEVDAYKEFDRETDKKFDKKELDDLTDDIRKNGIKKPIQIKVDRNGKALIVEGNTRLAAAKRLGIKNIPVEIIEGEFGSINKEKAKLLPDVGRSELQRRQQTELGLKDNNGAYSKGFTRVEQSLKETTKAEAPISEEVKNEEIGENKVEERTYTKNALDRADAKKVFAEIRRMDEPTSAEQIALEYLANGGGVGKKAIDEVSGTVKRASLNTGKKENLSNEVKSRDYYDPKETAGLDDIAHQLWELYGQKYSEQDIKDSLMREISENSSRLDAGKKYLERYSPEYAERKQQEKFYKEHLEEIAAEEKIINEFLNNEKELENEAFADENYVTNLIEKYEQETKGENQQSTSKTESSTNKGTGSTTGNEGNGKEPPKGEEPVGEGGNAGITHAANEVRRQDRNLPEYEKSPETFEQWNNEAEKLIKEGYDVEGLMDKMEKDKYDPNPVENAIRKIYIATLDAQIEKNPTDALLAKQKRFIQIGDAANSRAGRNLVSLKGEGSPLSSISDFYVAKMEAAGVDKLTEQQKKETKEAYDNVQKADENAQAAMEAYRAEIAKLKAENELLKQKKASAPKSNTPKTKDDFVSERKTLKEKLKQQFDDYKNSINKMGVVSDGGVEGFVITAKMAKTIGEIAKSYVDEIGVNLKEVTKRTFEEIKDLIVGISEKDIHDVLAGEYKQKLPTRDELAAKMRDLKDEAYYINKLDKLVSGKEPKVEKDKVKRNQQITELQKKIKDFQKEQPLTDAELKAKLKAIKTRNENEAVKLKERINKGDFEAKKPLPFLEDPEMQRKFPKEYKAALDAIVAREDARHEFDIALMKDQLAKRNLGKKGIDLVGDVIGTTKALVTGIDASGIGIQNLVAMISHPRSAAVALPASFGDFASAKRQERWLASVHNSKLFPLAQKAKLDITEPKSLKSSEKEEIFTHNLLDKKIKYKGKTYIISKYLTKPFERIFTGLGNRMRWNLWTRGVEKLYEEGYTWESHPEEFKSLAKVLNTETGRGTLHPTVDKAFDFISAGIWSPRLMASRMNILGIGDLGNLIAGGKRGYYGGLTPKMRAYALKDFAKFVMFGAGVMGLAGLTFADDVDSDPNSSTFGTMSVDGKRYNIWGGFTQYVRLIAKLIAGGEKNKGVFTESSQLKTLGRFMWSKTTPAVGTGLGLLSQGQRDYMGQPITGGGVAESLTIPLSIRGLVKGVQEEGAGSLLWTALPSFVGLNVSYESEFKDRGGNWDKEIKESAPFKTLTDNQVKLPEVPSNKKNMVIEDDAHPEGKMTEEEYKTFTEEWKKEVKKGVDELYNRGRIKTTTKIDEGGNVVSESNPSKVSMSDLDKENLEKELSSIKSEATEIAKKKAVKQSKTITTYEKRD